MSHTIRLERTFAAAPLRLWQAWTQPDQLDRWFSPNPELRVSAHADAREGGAYRINMGGEYIVAGTYLRLEEPVLLECSWLWEHETHPTRLRVELTPGDDGTRLVLVHSEFIEASDAEATLTGWQLSLDRLVDVLAG